MTGSLPENNVTFCEIINKILHFRSIPFFFLPFGVAVAAPALGASSGRKSISILGRNPALCPGVHETFLLCPHQPRLRKPVAFQHPCHSKKKSTRKKKKRNSYHWVNFPVHEPLREIVKKDNVISRHEPFAMPHFVHAWPNSTLIISCTEFVRT